MYKSKMNQRQLKSKYSKEVGPAAPETYWSYAEDDAGPADAARRRFYPQGARRIRKALKRQRLRSQLPPHMSS